MKFLLDAQFPPRLVKALKGTGHTAEHVYDCGLLTAPDRDIWDYATRESAVVMTKDADFATMRMSAGTGPAVVWVRLGNISDDDLIKALVSALPEITAAITAGEHLVEVR